MESLRGAGDSQTQISWKCAKSVLLWGRDSEHGTAQNVSSCSGRARTVVARVMFDSTLTQLGL